MTEQLINGNRTPLTGSFRLRFLDADGNPYEREVTVLSLVGMGGSSICYDVDVRLDETTHQKMILKQFYPDPGTHGAVIRPQGTELTIEDFDQRPDLQALAQGFEDAYELQNRLANAQQTMSVVVKPREKYFDGATKYVLYEANWGASLERNRPQTLKDILSLTHQAALALSRLHEAGWLHMDLKPENLLWVERRQVKLFDFDAAIDMKHLDRVQSIRTDSTRPQLLAPELRSTQSFQQNKRLYLTPKVDVYGLGCLMFQFLLGRLPEDGDLRENAWVPELEKLFAEKYRKRLTAARQKGIRKVLEKACAYNVQNRFRTAEQLAQELEKLLAGFSQDVSPADEEAQASYQMLAAYALDKNPLYPFVTGEPEERKRLQAVLVGDSPLAEAVVQNLFPCAQMPDTDLVIHIARPDPREYLDRLLRACPALGQVIRIQVDGSPYEGDSRYDPLSEAITAESYGIFAFHTFDPDTQNVEELLGMLRKREGILPRYYILAGSNGDRNLAQAKSLTALLARDKVPAFVGYVDDRGDGYDLRNLETEPDSPVRTAALGCNARYSADERCFRQEIVRRALKVHTYYTRQWNERATEKEILRDFRYSTDSYNLRSSLRSALSIPYKLAAVGAYATQDPAGEFYRKVLTDTPEAKRLRSRMIYLEHRSWNCFMILDGWQAPEDGELSEYLFTDSKHDHRDKVRKLHPCLCDSDPDSGLPLQELSEAAWITEHNRYRPKMDQKPYDPLDWISLRLHALCQLKTKLVNLDPVFDQLRDSLQVSGAPVAVFDQATWLYTIYQRMLTGESGINGAWSRACDQFAQAIAPLTDSVKRLFGNIKDAMKVVTERNLFHDYKSSDETILYAIPMLLNPKPIRRIYKPLGTRVWENLVSSLVTEAQELVLLTDGRAPLEQNVLDAWQSFFRGRGMEKMKITQCDLSQVRRIQIAEQAVVDVTGADPQMIYAISSHKVLRSLPVILYRQGKLVSPTGYREIAYYPMGKTLSVEETFAMVNAQVFSGDTVHSLMGLGGYALHLWNAYLDIQRKFKGSTFPWKLLTDLVAEEERKRYVLLNVAVPENKTELCTAWTSRRAIADSGLDKVMQDLKKEGLVEGFTLPASNGKIWFLTRYPDLAIKLNKAIELIQTEPYEHSFSLLHTAVAPITGKPLPQSQYFLKDDTLEIRTVVSRDAARNLGGSTFDVEQVFKTTLETLSFFGRNQSKANGCVMALARDIPLVSRTEDDQVRICFRFNSFSVRDCLMREGNVLEAYAYYTISRRTLFDDVKPNVSFVWAAEGEDAHLRLGAVVNEVDLVCTKGLRTYFISCKQCAPEKEFLTEVKYYADYFGVDATAIVLCSHTTTRDTSSYLPQSFLNRAKQMGVYFVGRSLVGDVPEDVTGGKLARVIQNIMDGKEDWENV